MKINLGCGTDIKKGWTNCDIRKGEGVDVVCDLLKKLPFKKNSVDEALAQDVFEHMPLKDTKKFLDNIYYVLKPGGMLTVEVPNIVMQAQQWLTGDITTERFSAIVYGGQDYAENFHYQLFDEGRLAKVLQEAGFVDVEIYFRGRALGARAHKNKKRTAIRKKHKKNGRYLYPVSDGLGNQIQQIVPYLYLADSCHLDPVYVPSTAQYNADTLAFWQAIAKYHKAELKVAQYGVKPSWWDNYDGCYTCQRNTPFAGIDELAWNDSPHAGSEVNHRNAIINDADEFMEKNLPLNWHKIRGIRKKSNGLTIICNGGTNSLTWTRKKYARYNELVDMLLATGHKVACVGMDDEFLPDTIDYTELSLLETMDLIANCKLFIGNDSGLYHFASVIGKRNVAIFTATSVVKNWHPIFHKSSTIIKGFELAGCREACQEDTWNLSPQWGLCKDWKCGEFDPVHIMKAVKGAKHG